MDYRRIAARFSNTTPLIRFTLVKRGYFFTFSIFSIYIFIDYLIFPRNDDMLFISCTAFDCKFNILYQYCHTFLQYLAFSISTFQCFHMFWHIALHAHCPLTCLLSSLSRASIRSNTTTKILMLHEMPPLSDELISLFFHRAFAMAFSFFSWWDTHRSILRILLIILIIFLFLRLNSYLVNATDKDIIYIQPFIFQIISFPRIACFLKCKYVRRRHVYWYIGAYYCFSMKDIIDAARADANYFRNSLRNAMYHCFRARAYFTISRYAFTSQMPSLLRYLIGQPMAYFSLADWYDGVAAASLTLRRRYFMALFQYIFGFICAWPSTSRYMLGDRWPSSYLISLRYTLLSPGYRWLHGVLTDDIYYSIYW